MGDLSLVTTLLIMPLVTTALGSTSATWSTFSVTHNLEGPNPTLRCIFQVRQDANEHEGVGISIER